MINETKFKELLMLSESETIDFKAEPHRLDNDYFSSEFIKDILAMANTPRETTAYIIIGVKFHSDDGSKDMLGVLNQPDDADLQSKMNLAKVDPKPRFIYQPIIYDNKSFGVIEIPVDKKGPFVATCDMNVVKANKIYFRRGTQNDEAKTSDTKKIYGWFLGEVNNGADPTEISVSNSTWENFYRSCHNFDLNRLYAFVIGDYTKPINSDWSIFGRVPTSLVLDFDDFTEKEGVFFYTAPKLRNARSVHLLTLGDKCTLVPENACYWYAAKGLDGRSNSRLTEPRT